jgi:hypothetical protein
MESSRTMGFVSITEPMTLPSIGVCTSRPSPSVRSGSRPICEKSSAARIMRSILPGTGTPPYPRLVVASKAGGCPVG